MKWLSIDLGKTCGLAYWEKEDLKSYCPLNLREEEFDKRLWEFWGKLKNIVTAMDVKLIVTEQPAGFSVKQWRGTLQVAQYYGVLKIICRKKKIDFYEMVQTTIKKAVTGNGRAKKDEMVAAISSLYCTPDNLNHNVADAIAIGHTYLDIMMDK